MKPTRSIGLWQRCYWELFNYFAAPGQRAHPVLAFRLHAFLMMFGIAQLLMLFFAVVAHFVIDHVVMWVGPWVCMLVLWLSLPVLRRGGLFLLGTNILLTAVTAYISLFCWFIDGFRESTFAWFSLVPLWAGILTTGLNTVIWGLVVSCLTLAGYLLSVYGHTLNRISKAGDLYLTPIDQVCFLLTILVMTLFMLRERKVAITHLREKAVAKQNLLRMLAHDIANPLSIVQMSLQLMGQSEHDEHTTRFLKQIERNTERIGGIIQLVRDMEMWDRERKPPPLTNLSVRDTVQSVLDAFRPRLEAKRLIVHVDIPEDYHLLAHVTMLREQVLGNLISNAVKFSPAGGRLTVRARADGVHIAIRVEDHGMGIPAQLVRDLFDPFAPTNRPGTAGETGLGHGLPIAKSCLDVMDGVIEVTARTGGGTVVEVRLRRVD